jgi:hypothetical protein
MNLFLSILKIFIKQIGLNAIGKENLHISIFTFSLF